MEYRYVPHGLDATWRHGSNARKWISMNQGRQFVSCVVRSRDPRYADIARDLQKQMPDWEMPLYNPRTEGTSSTHQNVGRYVGGAYADPTSVILLISAAWGLADATKDGKVPHVLVTHDAFGGCRYIMTDTAAPCP